MMTGFLLMLGFGMLSFACIGSVIPVADAHDIQLQPAASNAIMVENETFDRESMHTGEILTVRGILVNIADEDVRGWASIFSEFANTNNRWELLARDPPNVVFEVPKNSVVEYFLSAKALEPGTYHIHTAFGIDKVGAVFGPGQTIFVHGDPIMTHTPFTNIAYQLVPIVVGSLVAIAIACYSWKKIK
ncbi:methane monooxygenase/ammonia monooxygenase subunit B [archaeon]|nr:methane monooxygenase/ammonia monooxygenase subunit B [archaeon]